MDEKKYPKKIVFSPQKVKKGGQNGGTSTSPNIVGVPSPGDELVLQISCNIFLAIKWILMMTSGQNISNYTTAKLSVHVWNHDLIWWQNKLIETQKHFHKATITSSWTLSKTTIPITIVKPQMPSNPNQKSRTPHNKRSPNSLEHNLFTDCNVMFMLRNVIHVTPGHDDGEICWLQSIRLLKWGHKHYNDVIMSTMASKFTSLTIVSSTVYWGADQRKHQSSASLAFTMGIHRSPVNSPH